MKRNQTLHLISAVALVTLLAKVLGIVREALQARAFGTQAAADLYTIASNYTIYLLPQRLTRFALPLSLFLLPGFSAAVRKDMPLPTTSLPLPSCWPCLWLFWG